MTLRAAIRRFQADTFAIGGGFNSRVLARNREQCLHFASRRHGRKASFSSKPTLQVDEVAIDSHEPSLLQSRLHTIMEPYYRDQRPVLVKGAVQKAPATKLWCSWDYWQDIAVESDGSDQMVAVEIGGSYGSEGCQRAEIPLAGYLQFLQLFEERHGRFGFLPGDSNDNTNGNSNDIPTEELVYMAQNDLLKPLYKDILIPDFCQNGSETGSDPSSESNSESIGLGRLYSVMMWLGPRGCYSPLHYDPLDNCLMQHLGRKRVLLFEPSSNAQNWHYAGHDGQQSNTSPIDPQVLDTDNDILGGTKNDLLQDYQKNYPAFFEEAPRRMECLLEPGDFLYIPSKWWHHVRSIDTSASVNVWWR